MSLREPFRRSGGATQPHDFGGLGLCLQPGHEDLDTPARRPPPEKVRVSHLTFRYGDTIAVNDVSLPLYENRVTSFIGPSGCGKSTLLRVLNRMHDAYPDQHAEGEVLLDGVDILGAHVDVNRLRSRIGMVFQVPAPFPMSIRENIAFGVGIHENLSRAALDERVESALRLAGLWDEVKDQLSASGLSLSGGQQQRLCIARTIAARPEVILLDEPCSALDPGSAAKIEQTIHELKVDHTVVIVTHNLPQAARVSDYAAFLFLGRLIEFGTSHDIWLAPQDERTRGFVGGKFG
jgi:phosphate transport system ATP-binding protein